MDKNKSSLFLGIILILSGLIYLFDNLGIFYFNDDVFISLLFLGGGAFLFFRFHQNRRFPLLIFASLVTFIGIAILLDSFRAVDDALIGIVLFWGMSAIFAYGFGKNTEKWGLLIPSGILFSLGLIVVFNDVFYYSDDFCAGVFFLGIGLTFTFLYLIKNERNNLNWAKVPAAILIFISGIIFLNTSDSVFANMLLPMALIICGGYMIYCSTQRSAFKKI